MLNKSLNLSDKIFSKDIEKKGTRDGFGEGLVLAGERSEDIVVLTADLAESTRVIGFREKFPDRFVECGVAEQGMITLASGMANYGKVPFATSFAVFSPGRNWEQIKTTIAINDVSVKIVGVYGGIGNGKDGATHQAFEDIALMRVLPGVAVVCPCDYNQAIKATIAIAESDGPTYLRLTKESPVFTTSETPFEIGRAQVFWQSKDAVVGIIATGPLVYEALVAAKELENEGVGSIVVNCHTIKPLDEDLILEVAQKVSVVVTAEEHQTAGGLGGAVSEFLSSKHPTKMGFVGMQNRFGESGNPEELANKFELNRSGIVKKVKSVLG